MYLGDIFYQTFKFFHIFCTIIVSIYILYKLTQDIIYYLNNRSCREIPPRLKFKAYLSYLRNSKRLLDIFSGLIDKYESEAQKKYYSLAPSCKEEMLGLMKSRLSMARDEISEWKDIDTDYIRIAHIHLAISSFDLLTSGRFHLYYGTLNPMSCASNLKRIHDRAINYGLEKGYITIEEAQEDFQALAQEISEVG